MLGLLGRVEREELLLSNGIETAVRAKSRKVGGRCMMI